MIADLRCGNCNRRIGKNVVGGEFKCPKCGTFVVVQTPEFVRVSWHPAYEVDSKAESVV